MCRSCSGEVCQVDRGRIDAHVDRIDGARGIDRAGRDAEQNRHRDHGAQKTQIGNLRLRDPVCQAQR